MSQLWRQNTISGGFQFKSNHKTVCNNCGTTLTLANGKSWSWGFLLDFIAIIITGKIYLHFHDNFLFAATVGIIFGIITVFIIALYIYRTTKVCKD